MSTLRMLAKKRAICENSAMKRRMGVALVLAADNGDAAKVTELLSHRTRVNARDRGFTPLLAAALQGHADVCELLLDLGNANIEEVEFYGNTALNTSAREGHTDTVALLLSKGARVDNVNENGFTPLLSAANGGHDDVCRLLLSTGKTNVEQALQDKP